MAIGLAPDFIVNQDFLAGQGRCFILALNGGGFFVVFEDENESGEGANNYGITGRFFDSEGIAATDGFQLNTTVQGFQSNAQAIELSNGIRSISQIGQSPGSFCRTCGCIEQIHSCASLVISTA